jgi:DNA-binding NarL/FixJ family response regulator
MRVLLIGMSRMLSDIIRAALAEAPGITIAGNVRLPADIALEVRLANADAVIMEISEPSVSTNFSPLLQSFPALKVVAIDSTSRTGYVHQLCPCSIVSRSFRLRHCSQRCVATLTDTMDCRVLAKMSGGRRARAANGSLCKMQLRRK